MRCCFVFLFRPARGRFVGELILGGGDIATRDGDRETGDPGHRPHPLSPIELGASVSWAGKTFPPPKLALWTEPTGGQSEPDTVLWTVRGPLTGAV